SVRTLLFYCEGARDALVSNRPSDWEVPESRREFPRNGVHLAADVQLDVLLHAGRRRERIGSPEDLFLLLVFRKAERDDLAWLERVDTGLESEPENRERPVDVPSLEE